MLEVSHITKEFNHPFSLFSMRGNTPAPKKAVTALDDVSFSLAKGKILGILGPNGAGKTTLLKVLSTLILPEKGSAIINGYSLGRDDEKIKYSIGLALTEERSFYWRLSGRQNLEFFASLYGLSPKMARARIHELLGLFGIGYADKRFDSYSSGMKMHFALLRCLIHNPEIILLDEPAKSLDYRYAFTLRNFLKERLVKAQGKTIIFTTHNMNEALELADIFIVLDKGKLLAFGTLEELRKQIADPSASLDKIYLSLIGKPEGLRY